MSLVEEQFEELKRWTGENGSELRALPDGSHMISVPNVKLPPGWSLASTTIRFIAPPAYPHAKPDCFWADANLTLRSGAAPQASNLTPTPHGNQPLRWFSWHTTTWGPNRDTLITYFLVIKDRLKDPR